jgi:hypothetical protein
MTRPRTYDGAVAHYRALARAAMFRENVREPEAPHHHQWLEYEDVQRSIEDRRSRPSMSSPTGTGTQ